MSISIRMSDEEKELASAYAKLKGYTLSEAIKKVFFEQIEEEFDIELANEALKDYKKDQKTYSLEDVKKELDI